MSWIEQKASARLDPGSNRSWAAAGADNDISAASSAQPLNNVFRVKVFGWVAGQMILSQIVEQSIELCWADLPRACMGRGRALAASTEFTGI